MELVRQIRLRVEGGLHARPASELVRLAKRFAARVTLKAGGREALATSSLKLLTLGAKEGDEITLHASGEEAEAALAAVGNYLSAPAQGGETASPGPAPEIFPSAPGAAGQGLGVSPGRAIGPVFVLRQPELTPEPDTIDPAAVETETARALAAQAAVARRCRDGAADPAARAVLIALADLAGDEDWAARIAARIAGGASALAAILASGDEISREIAALDDAYAAARAEDMRAATQLVALELQGKQPVSLADAPDGAVVVADELAAIHLGHGLSRLGGIVTARGAATGHAAILLRAAGVPAVFGAGAALARCEAAEILALDGATGEVIADPGPDVVQAWHAAIAAARDEARALDALRDRPPVTRDGVAVVLAANIGSVADAEKAREAGAMGVGLFRTEFLFLDRADLPGEEEQLAAYSRVLELFPGHDVIIRTLDIGGDKPARGIQVPREDNPFLGLRGIRLCLARPEVFRIQLRALLRAAPRGRLMVMLPMVADVHEIRETRAMIAQARAELVAEGLAHGDFALGIMVETPAAVFCAEDLAAEADFFSIGTNDLTQYVMAADRTNPGVAGLCRADNPAVLAAIARATAAATAAGKLTGVCGEAAGDPALIPFLLRAGVRELSMSPAALPRARRAVLDLSVSG
ncbi:phosphoenolpyruvate--protein phosphotransferase [Pseudogemmobacter humi]|uniref:Phosphoenolpyruvate-protein phosphotransferase n=1 Tax=Pseudogemmobacter humi TaxID=2483812 RepID=A0A3P5X7P2_9RHOB|nr:phosphoenolpyruvate--protein phosphotransferase [Pseudogemmobacter humi]VDC30670.1 Phosphoenolpyruvate-protein phosphotransferase [Pseudogemmobacter humi]